MPAAGLRNTTNTAPHGSRCNGTVVRPFVILNDAGVATARVRVPELGLLAADAERGLDVLVAIVAVVHEVQVTVGERAMNREKRGVGVRLRVLEVWRHAEPREHVAQAAVGDSPSLCR